MGTRWQLVTRDKEKLLPQAGKPQIKFMSWWFKHAWSEIGKPWRYQKSNWFMHTRGANYAQVWIGPFSIIWSKRWLEGPARSLHPEAFKDVE